MAGPALSASPTASQVRAGGVANCRGRGREQQGRCRTIGLFPISSKLCPQSRYGSNLYSPIQHTVSLTTDDARTENALVGSSSADAMVRSKAVRDLIARLGDGGVAQTEVVS